MCIFLVKVDIETPVIVSAGRSTAIWTLPLYSRREEQNIKCYIHNSLNAYKAERLEKVPSLEKRI